MDFCRESVEGSVVYKDSDVVRQMVHGYQFQYGVNDFFQINPEVLEVCTLINFFLHVDGFIVLIISRYK